jgi:hypothetical protein
MLDRPPIVEKQRKTTELARILENKILSSLANNEVK